MTTRSALAPTLILNGRAGVREQVAAERLAELFAAHGVDVRVVPCGEGVDLCELAREAIERKCPLVIAAGGDGTISAVASVLAGTETALGVLPLGTLNHFAKDLGIPTAIDLAVATIVAGREVRVDVGEVNDRVFINNSSIGLYPTMVRNREAHQRLGRRKWSAFARAMLTAVGRYPLIRVTIDVDGRSIVRRTPLLFVGNNDYHIHGLNLGTRDRLDGGRLAVYVTRDVGRRKLFGFAVRVLLGRLRESVDFDALQAEQVTIHARRNRLSVATDGEVSVFATPLEYRIRPGGLRVVVPAASGEPPRPE